VGQLGFWLALFVAFRPDYHYQGQLGLLGWLSSLYSGLDYHHQGQPVGCGALRTGSR
jgi:hypothetical protein